MGHMCPVPNPASEPSLFNTFVREAKPPSRSRQQGWRASSLPRGLMGLPRNKPPALPQPEDKQGVGKEAHLIAKGAELELSFWKDAGPAPPGTYRHHGAKGRGSRHRAGQSCFWGLHELKGQRGRQGSRDGAVCLCQDTEGRH